MNSAQPQISVVIPLFNEESSLELLHAKLSRVLEQQGQPYEILFIDDGSTDESSKAIEAITSSDPHVGSIQFGRNFGKAAALKAGFDRARGDVIVTMDADLQDDPEEIPTLLTKLADGYDLVSGWKKVRRDPFGKRMLSWIFNVVVRQLSGVRLRDFNCGFKAYRRDVAARINLYGELHRYTPVLAHWAGARVAEVAVRHHPRQHGRSKYGVERVLKGFFDMLTVLLLTRYRARPLHLFGFGGLLLSLLGTTILVYLSALWFMDLGPIGTRPLLFLGLLLMMVGVQLVSTGLLGEMMSGMYHTGERSYVVRKELAPGQSSTATERPQPIGETSDATHP